MADRLILTRSHWQAMRRHVARRVPLEACGLLAGRGDRVETTRGVPNAARSPVRFRMAPREQWRAFQRIEAAGLELVGIYHSHPQGPDHPSPTDVAEAMYPVVQLIWYRAGGGWQARGFRIAQGKFSEVALQIGNPE
jgi:proteasome lid subunit RPN8/RPN11